ncbi:MAG: PPC domain-containing DNA-binding protein [Thermoanaerobaculia bacterium]
MKSTLLRRRKPRTHLLVFAIDDDVKTTLLRFARDENILSAHFHALGALQRVTVAYWNWGTKDYSRIEINEQVEVVSFVGNLSRDAEGRPKLHAHAALGKRDGTLVGGHFVDGSVRPTLELVLEEGEEEVVRRKDDVTGLDLIDL